MFILVSLSHGAGPNLHFLCNKLTAFTVFEPLSKTIRRLFAQVSSIDKGCSRHWWRASPVWSCFNCIKSRMKWCAWPDDVSKASMPKLWGPSLFMHPNIWWCYVLIKKLFKRTWDSESGSCSRRHIASQSLQQSAGRHAYVSPGLLAVCPLIAQLGCCAVGENTTTLHRSSVIFYIGSQFLFASSLRSVCWSTSHCAWVLVRLHSSALGLRLQSTDKCDLHVRRMKALFGDRAFSAVGPRCWNRLPAVLRAANSIDSFKTGLKTYLFNVQLCIHRC